MESEAVKYKVVNGTSYHVETSDEVIRILEICRTNKTRIVLDYGDTESGKSWGDKYGITGYVGRSTGGIKIPILMYNSKSIGGGAILDHCIISIKTSIGRAPLYTHPNYVPYICNL
jgi:hypothetical protein